MAREKPRSATLAEFEQLMDKYGHLEEVAFGLVAGFSWVRQRGVPRDSHVDERLAFLGWFLDQEYQRLSYEIYSAVVGQMIDLFDLALDVRLKMRVWHWENKLVSFLASHEPLEGVRAKVSSYLRDVAHYWLYVGPKSYPQLDEKKHLENVARALLRYKNFEAVRELFVDPKVYDAIPALFEVVVEQVGEANAYCVVPLVMGGWDVPKAIVKAFQSIGKDSRALRLLLDLSQAYLNEHRRSYPLEKAVLT